MNEAQLEYIPGGASEAGSHRLADIFNCPRKFALNRNPPANVPRLPLAEFLIRGTLIHAALCHLYARRMPGGKDKYLTPEDAIRRAAQEGNDERPSASWATWAETLQPMPAQYEIRWGPEPVWEILGVEQELRAQIADPLTGKKHLYSARYDLLIRHKGENKVYVIDHKSARFINTATNNTYALSGQVLGYGLLGRAIYKEAWGNVFLNYISEPDKEGKFSFGRTRLPPAPEAQKSYKETILAGERLMGTFRETYGAENAGWPGTFGPACIGPFAPCEYRDFCRLGIDAHKELE